MPKFRNETEAYVRNVGLDFKAEYDASNNILYFGECFPGAATSEAKWKIWKGAYDASNNQTSLRWAKISTETINSDEFNKIWDNRATYDYKDI